MSTFTSFTRTANRAPATSTARRRHTDALVDLRSELMRVAVARQTQLLALRPVDANNRVEIEYRTSVRRIYNDIHAALDRIEAGTYGDCTNCGARMPLERLLIGRGPRDANVALAGRRDRHQQAPSARCA